MARLNESQRRHIVQRLACFVGAAEIQREAREIWGMEISFQAIAQYNPEVASTTTAKKWIKFYERCREAFLTEVAKEGIAHPRWRTRERQALYDRAKEMGASGNIPLCLQILEQAEKAEGGMFTNTRLHEHSGKVEGGVLMVPMAPPADDWNERARQAQGAGASGHGHGGG